LASTTQAREWTNKKGKKVAADYVTAEGGFVQLKSSVDGQIYNVAIESLSEADQLLIGNDYFTRKLRENPEDVSLYIQRASARINRGDYQTAIRDFNHVIKTNPKNAEAYDGRGAAYSKMEQPLKAHADFGKAIELDAQLASAYRHRGENYKQLANTAEGKIMVDKKVEKYRQSYQAARREQLRSKGWQPLNSTSGNVSRYGAVAMLAKADYELAERIEDGYDVGRGGYGVDGGYGVHIGGGVGIGVGTGVGVGIGVGPGYPGVTVNSPPLGVYPIKVVQGDTIELVANPTQLAKGMPQALGANGKPIRTAYGKSAKSKIEVNSVDFYRDADGDKKLNTAKDQFLGTDAVPTDGLSLKVSTEGFPAGPQNYFASPQGDQASGLSETQMVSIADQLEKAAAAEKKIAKQNATAYEGSGLTAEQAEGLGKQNQDDVSEAASDAYKQLRTAIPEVADMVSEAAKPVRAVGNLMKAAARKPGEESKEKASDAAEKAESAADQLAAAAAKLREIAESGETPKAQGAPAAAPGEILPKEQVAQAPPAKPGPGAPGGPGKGGGDYGNDDDDDVVVIDDDDDDVIVIDDDDYDDDDVVVVRDDDDDRVVIVDDDDYDRVINDYDRLLIEDRDNVIVRRDRAGAYLTGGNYDYAIRDYGTLLQNNTISIQQQIDFYYNRGCAHLAAGSLENAIADFTASIELKETGPLAYMAFNNRGIAYAKQSKFDKALLEFNRAIDINSKDPLAHKNRALALKKLGKTVEAAESMARYNQLSSL
jgi:tetratricopeptide (TPR) repeat protein